MKKPPLLNKYTPWYLFEKRWLGFALYTYAKHTWHQPPLLAVLQQQPT